MKEYSSPHSLSGCGAMPLQIADKTDGKILLLHTFFGQICQGVVLVKLIDIFTIWSIIDFV